MGVCAEGMARAKHLHTHIRCKRNRWEDHDVSEVEMIANTRNKKKGGNKYGLKTEYVQYGS